MPDIIPLQKDEEFGGTSQASIELGAQVAASGTALTQLGANWKSKREAAVSARLHGRALHTPASASKHRHHRQEGQGPGQLEDWAPAALTRSPRLPAPLQPGVTAPCPMPAGASATPSTGARVATAAAVRSRTQKQPPTLHRVPALSPHQPLPPSPVHQPCRPCWADTHKGHVPGWASTSPPRPLSELAVPSYGRAAGRAGTRATRCWSETV